MPTLLNWPRRENVSSISSGYGVLETIKAHTRQEMLAMGCPSCENHDLRFAGDIGFPTTPASVKMGWLFKAAELRDAIHFDGPADVTVVAVQSYAYCTQCGETNRFQYLSYLSNRLAYDLRSAVHVYSRPVEELLYRGLIAG